jgi:quercetin dioxygenase-like cupin family protein
LNKTEHLEGGCLVTHPEGLDYQQQGALRWCRVAGPSEGTKKLAQFYFELGTGNSGNISFTDSEVVLYLISGRAMINIAGREFQVVDGCGVHVRSGEAVLLQNAAEKPVCFTATICPGSESFTLLPEMTTEFDARFPDRVVETRQSEQQASGDRFYRLLVGPQTQSEKVTQFIGMIPRSKAPEHFHLYEEVIYILSGSGHMWAGQTHTPIKAGSMIFLPAKQKHCLECTHPDGMLLVGSFYPAGSPAVNYAAED